MKKIVTAFCFMLFLSGCVVDVSKESPHSKLLGVDWKLKTDVYVIKYDDGPEYVIYPCTSFFAGVLPDGETTYNEKNIGRYYYGKTIVAGYRKGTVFNICRVLKTTEFEVGTTYAPTMLPVDAKPKQKELDGSSLYFKFKDKGILNPEYAEPVSK